jgi:hypothetical protein
MQKITPEQVLAVIRPVLERGGALKKLEVRSQKSE